jgi:hypothetical protein
VHRDQELVSMLCKFSDCAPLKFAYPRALAVYQLSPTLPCVILTLARQRDACSLVDAWDSSRGYQIFAHAFKSAYATMKKIP